MLTSRKRQFSLKFSNCILFIYFFLNKILVYLIYFYNRHEMNFLIGFHPHHSSDQGLVKNLGMFNISHILWCHQPINVIMMSISCSSRVVIASHMAFYP